MKELLRSPVLAACILSIGLVASALIVARPTAVVIGQSPNSLWEQKIKTQFVSQVEAQLGGGSYEVMDTKRQLQNIVIDKMQKSPKGNRIDIEYHAVWQGTDVATYTRMALIEDGFGRFTSGRVSGTFDDKALEVTVQ